MEGNFLQKNFLYYVCLYIGMHKILMTVRKEGPTLHWPHSKANGLDYINNYMNKPESISSPQLVLPSWFCSQVPEFTPVILSSPSCIWLLFSRQIESRVHHKTSIISNGY